MNKEEQKKLIKEISKLDEEINIGNKRIENAKMLCIPSSNFKREANILIEKRNKISRQIKGIGENNE